MKRLFKTRPIHCVAIVGGLLSSLNVGAEAPAAAAEAEAAPAAGASYIAGVNPSQRPAGAPSITEVSRDGKWMAAGLQGVSQPYPASLLFLQDQGNWYTPFTLPGMTGPYDIRGWHQP